MLPTLCPAWGSIEKLKGGALEPGGTERAAAVSWVYHCMKPLPNWSRCARADLGLERIQ